MIIKVANTLTQGANYTYLSSNEVSGTATIRVRNVSGFTPSYAIQIGQTGEEQSEILVLGTAAIAGTSLTATTALSYDHASDTPLFQIKYDKLIIKRSTSGTAGTAVAITDGTINITPDGTATLYDDTTGDSSYAYKAAFLNSVSGSASADSDWLPGTGMAFYALGRIRERIRGKLFSYGMIKDGATIDDWTNEWLEELTNSAIKVNESYALGTVAVAFGTSGLGTITSADYRLLKKMTITFNGVDEFLTTKKDESRILPDERFSNVHPYYSWQGDSVFKVRPPESGGTANLIYHKRNSYLENDNDFLPLQMRSYTNSFIDYALAEAYYSDGQVDRGDRFYARAQAGKQRFVEEMTPRDFTGVEMMQIDFPVNNFDFDNAFF